MSLLAFLGTQELTLVVILALVVFGGSQLPKLARNLGRAQKELQKGMAEGARVLPMPTAPRVLPMPTAPRVLPMPTAPRTPPTDIGTLSGSRPLT